MSRRCACPDPDGDPATRDKDCPEHGLATLDIPPGLREYRYPDGITVHATSEEAADAARARLLARRHPS